MTPSVAPRAAFQHPGFRLFQAARLFATVGIQMQSVAVAWQVYAITQKPVSLGYVGLAQFAPAFGLSLVAGHVADRIDRRRVVFCSYLLVLACALSLLFLSYTRSSNVFAIYVVLFVFGVARAFGGPAAQALMPSLVPTEHFPNAVAWSSTIWQVATVAGPSLGGLVYGAGGAPSVYTATAVLTSAAAVLVALIRASTPAPEALEKKAVSWSTFSAGLRYVWHQRVLLGCISLDLFAVLLGGAVALLPVFASDVLHTGPWGLGVLRSAPALGATAVAILLAYRPLRQRSGAVMLSSVGVFGGATVVFGLSRNLALSVLALVVLGAADMVSVFVRSTLVQLNTPHAMRGRVSAVNMMFVVASNELGEFESGLTAAWLGAVPAVILGGIGSCVVVLAYAVLFPELRRVNRLDDAGSKVPPAQPAVE